MSSTNSLWPAKCSFLILTNIRTEVLWFEKFKTSARIDFVTFKTINNSFLLKWFLLSTLTDWLKKTFFLESIYAAHTNNRLQLWLLTTIWTAGRVCEAGFFFLRLLRASVLPTTSQRSPTPNTQRDFGGKHWMRNKTIRGINISS